jgi:hypothetical protein
MISVATYLIIWVLTFLIIFCFYNCFFGKKIESGMLKKFTKKDGFSPHIIDQMSSINTNLTREFLLDKVRSIPHSEVSWAPGLLHRFNNRCQNIVFSVGVPKSPYIIVMAHYDKYNNNWPTANDNGSGVFGLLKVAKRLASKNKVPQNGVLFVLTDCEETGMGGSRAIHKLFPSGNTIINIDTIGGYNKVIRISNNGAYDKYILQNAQEKNIDVITGHIRRDRSDMEHFIDENTCIEFGYTTEVSEYHSTKDTYDKLYINNLYKVIDMAGTLVEDLGYGRLM